MGKKYEGTGNVSRVRPAVNPGEIFITCRLAPSRINYLKSIIEGYEYLGFLVPLKGNEGLVGIHTTDGMEQDLREVLKNLPFKIEIHG